MENAVETVKRRRSAAGNGGAGDEWRKLVADVEDLVKKVANVRDEEIAQIRDKVQHTLEKAKATAGAGVTAVRERTEEATEATDAYVHENPWAAVGIAAAVGIVIGFIAGRR